MVTKLKDLVLRKIFRKYLFNRNFLEKHNAENLQDFAQTQLDFEFFLDNCYENVNPAHPPAGGGVNTDGNPDLSLHSVFGSAEKCFDTKMLFEPFAVLLAFITSQERVDSFAAEKWLCNRQGLHHVRFETIFRGNETLCGKKF